MKKKLLCFFFPSLSFCFRHVKNPALRHDIGHKIKKLNETLDKIDKNREQFGSSFPSLSLFSIYCFQWICDCLWLIRFDRFVWAFIWFEILRALLEFVVWGFGFRIQLNLFVCPILFWTFWVVFGSMTSMQLEFDGFLSFSFVPLMCLRDCLT